MADYKKKYEEALERMKSLARGEHPECFSEAQKAAEFVFPELNENEDERIRKALIALLEFCLEDGSAIAPGFNETKEQALTWLEKQCEPKQPNRLSKNQEYTLNRIIEYLEDNSCSEEWLDLLHEIHDAPYIKQKSVKWTVQDDDMLLEISSNLLYAAKNRPTCNMEIYKCELDWLKRIYNK